MDLKQAFGLALRELRVARGLTQDALGSSQNFISNLEWGKKAPSLEKFAEIAEGLGVHPVTLMLRCFEIAGVPSEELLKLAAVEIEEVKRTIKK